MLLLGHNSTMKRPLGVTVLGIIVFFFSVYNCLRLVEGIVFRNTLEEFGAHSLYIILSGGFWLSTGLFLTWSLWKIKTWSWLASLGASVGYISWYWFDRLVLQLPHANWLFALGTTIVFLLIIFIILFSPPSRLYFIKKT